MHEPLKSTIDDSTLLAKNSNVESKAQISKFIIVFK